jgi:purine-binding chemotaxis protein CheW
MRTKTNHRKTIQQHYLRAFDFMPKDDVSQQILRKRAAFIAKEDITITENTGTVDYIHFIVGKNEHYGIPYPYIKEVIDHVAITQIPCALESVAGVINRHGSLLAVINLSVFFQLQDTPPSENCNVIVVESNGITLGIIVDKLVDSDTYNPDEMKMNDTHEGVINTRYIVGLDQGKTAILHIKNMIADLQQQLKTLSTQE